MPQTPFSDSIRDHSEKLREKWSPYQWVYEYLRKGHIEERLLAVIISMEQDVKEWSNLTPPINYWGLATSRLLRFGEKVASIEKNIFNEVHESIFTDKPTKIKGESKAIDEK